MEDGYTQALHLDDTRMSGEARWGSFKMIKPIYCQVVRLAVFLR